MKKIYIIIGVGLIILLSLIIIIGLLAKSKTTEKSQVIPTPTLTMVSVNNRTTEITSDIRDILPVETADFSLAYSPSLKQIVVQEKTVDARQNFYDWAYQNSYPQLVEDKSLTNFTKLANGGISEKKSGNEVLMDFLNVFLNFGQGVSTSNQNQSSSIQSPGSLTSSSSNFTYYYQCGSYGSYSLPSGCTLCSDGC